MNDANGQKISVGDVVTPAEISCDAEDDLGEVLAIGPGDIVHVRWWEARETYTEAAGSLLVSREVDG